MIVISKQFHSTSLHHGHSGLLAANRYHHLLGRNLQIVFLIIITCSNLSSVQATAPSLPPRPAPACLLFTITTIGMEINDFNCICQNLSPSAAAAAVIARRLNQG